MSNPFTTRLMYGLSLPRDEDKESKTLKDLFKKKKKSEESKLDIMCPKCGHKIKTDIKRKINKI